MAQVKCLDPICPQEIADTTGWFGPLSKEDAYGVMLKFKTLKCEFEVVTNGFDGFGYVNKTFSGSFPIIQGNAIASADWNVSTFSVNAQDRWGVDAEVGQVCNGSEMFGTIACVNSGEGATGGSIPTTFTNNISGVVNYTPSSLMSLFSVYNEVTYQEQLRFSCRPKIATYGGLYYLNVDLSSDRGGSYNHDFQFASKPILGGGAGGDISIYGLTSEPMTISGFINPNGPISVTASASIYAVNSWNYLP